MECYNFQYAVKFVCGQWSEEFRDIVAPGDYFTAINIHNPADGAVSFQYKVAVAKRGVGTKPSIFFNLKLESDEALEIDCPDINRHGEIQGFAKGFVVIESDVELDVVAVYTAAGGRERQVVSIHTERVAARRPVRLPRPGPLPEQS
jgi:hypothetical protein